MTIQPNDQRVTLGILGEKIDRLTKQLDEVLERYRTDHDVLLTHSGQITALMTSIIRHETRIEEVDHARKLESRIEVLAAGILAAFGLVWPKR